MVNINTFLDSSHVPSHQLEQLNEEEVQEHIKVYTKELRKSFIKHNAVELYMKMLGASNLGNFLLYYTAIQAAIRENVNK